jgi:hypothetical protein
MNSNVVKDRILFWFKELGVKSNSYFISLQDYSNAFILKEEITSLVKDLLTELGVNENYLIVSECNTLQYKLKSVELDFSRNHVHLIIPMDEELKDLICRKWRERNMNRFKSVDCRLVDDLDERAGYLSKQCNFGEDPLISTNFKIEMEDDFSGEMNPVLEPELNFEFKDKKTTNSVNEDINLGSYYAKLIMRNERRRRFKNIIIRLLFVIKDYLSSFGRIRILRNLNLRPFNRII